MSKGCFPREGTDADVRENQEVRWERPLIGEVSLEEPSDGAVRTVPSGIGIMRFGAMIGERGPP